MKITAIGSCRLIRPLKLLEEQKLPLTKTDEKTNKRRRKNYNEVCDELLQKNILEYAESGVDFVSIGSITHSASIIDMSIIKV